MPYTNFIECFDYIKTGKYNKDLGGLDSLTTNQKFYKIENNDFVDITHMFYDKVKERK